MELLSSDLTACNPATGEGYDHTLLMQNDRRGHEGCDNDSFHDNW